MIKTVHSRHLCFWNKQLWSKKNIQAIRIPAREGEWGIKRCQSVNGEYFFSDWFLFSKWWKISLVRRMYRHPFLLTAREQWWGSDSHYEINDIISDGIQWTRSNITINQAAVVILVLSLSGRSLREVFLLTLQFKTFYLYLFSGALGTTVLNLLLETKKTRRYTQVKICFTSKESYNLTMKYIFKTNQRWHTYV